jgi:hypothetical protein
MGSCNINERMQVQFYLAKVGHPLPCNWKRPKTLILVWFTYENSTIHTYIHFVKHLRTYVCTIIEAPPEKKTYETSDDLEPNYGKYIRENVIWYWVSWVDWMNYAYFVQIRMHGCKATLILSPPAESTDDQTNKTGNKYSSKCHRGNNHLRLLHNINITMSVAPMESSFVEPDFNISPVPSGNIGESPDVG